MSDEYLEPLAALARAETIAQVDAGNWLNVRLSDEQLNKLADLIAARLDERIG